MSKEIDPTSSVTPANTRPQTEAGVPANVQGFRDDLFATTQLHKLNPTKLKWAGTKPIDVNTPPKPFVQRGDHDATISVMLEPTDNEGKAIDGKNHRAAMFVRDVRPLSMTNLGNYIVRGQTGVPESESIFDVEKTLLEVLDDPDLVSLHGQINNETPVLEAIAFLPFSPTNQYNTEFAPHVTSMGSSLIVTINQDQLRSPNIIYGIGVSGEIQKKEETGETKNWRADRIPDLSIFETELLPSSAGHMIIIEIPAIIEQQPPAFEFDTSFYSGNLRGGGHTYGATRSINLSGVSISGGSKRESNTTKFEGGLRPNTHRKPVITHLTLIGAKPEQARKIGNQEMDRLEDLLDNYEHN